jgi:hypothetical protein
MSASDNHTMVCLLDVLGFEAKLAAVGLNSLRAKYDALVQCVKDKTGGVVGIDLPDGPAVTTVYIGHAYFSDTILFWMRYEPIKAQFFTRVMADLVCNGLELGLPLRGSIAVGEAVLDGESGVFLGQPLVEAARVEKEQRWIGVSFGPSLRPPDFYRFYPFMVQQYRSHYKDTAGVLATGMVLDWPRYWRETRKTDPCVVISALDSDSRFSSYYQSTSAFVDYSETNYDWYRRKTDK